MKNFDNSFLNEDVRLIAGIDEAGRGPLAGPVVAAAVIFTPECYIERVNDSKKVSEPLREELFELIKQKAVCYSISEIDHCEIDRINILQATLAAMKQSCSSLAVKPDIVLIDGNKAFQSRFNCLPVVKGDEKSFCIAAASILAKVTRDRIMRRYSELYPEYMWHKNKGYATKEHIEALLKYGPTPLHRRSFIKNFLQVSDDSGKEGNKRTNW